MKKSDILKMVVELYDCEPRMFKEQFDKARIFKLRIGRYSVDI